MPQRKADLRESRSLSLVPIAELARRSGIYLHFIGFSGSREYVNFPISNIMPVIYRLFEVPTAGVRAKRVCTKRSSDDGACGKGLRSAQEWQWTSTGIAGAPCLHRDTFQLFLRNM